MTLTRGEAAEALAAVETAQRRSGVLARYAGGGPVLMLWGAHWFTCNLTQQFAPAAASWLWPAATAVVLALSLWLSGVRGGAGRGWRSLATAGAIAGWLACAFALAGPRDARAADALISFTAATAYLVLGVWTGARYALLGAALAGLILAGWALAGPWFYAWMGVAGGGALALGGLWLRRA